jgi:hypothetical protein
MKKATPAKETPVCRACGATRWFAHRLEDVEIEIDLDPETGQFGEDTVVDAELREMTFRCRACGDDAGNRASNRLQAIFYADSDGTAGT